MTPRFIQCNSAAFEFNCRGKEKGGLPRARDILPISLPPRGLSRCEAAAYIGISPTLFDHLVQDGRMPQPKRIGARTVWDRRALDLAFAAIPNGSDDNPWDDEGEE